MSRIHIFDILNQEVNFRTEYYSILKLIDEQQIYNNGGYTKIIKFADLIEGKFRAWNKRGTFLDFESLLKKIDHIDNNVRNYIIKFLLLAELLLNLIHDEVIHKLGNSTVDSWANSQINYIIKNINTVLERSGYHYKLIEDKVYILVKRPEAITVTEITNDYQVLEYNHFSLKGDLNKKMAIINHLYKSFEPKRKELEDKEYKSLYEDYAFLANNFSRHNSEENLKLLKTDESDIEQILDCAYDLYLTVILIDNYLNVIKQPVNLLKKSLKTQK